MRIPTKDEIMLIKSIDPIWSYDEKYNNFYQIIGFHQIIIDTDTDLDNELELQSKNNKQGRR